MTVPKLLQTAGVFFLVTAAVLVVLCVRVFVRHDIRGVYDDLAGRSRQRGIDQAVYERSRREAISTQIPSASAIDKGDSEDYETRLVPKPPSQSEQTVVVRQERPVTNGENAKQEGGE